MSDQYVPALRQRFLEDMRIKGLQSKTQTMYLRGMRDFTRFLGHAPDSATPEELRAFQLDMKERGIGAPTFNNRLTVLSFFLAQLALIMRGVLQAGCLRRRQVSRAAFGGSEGRQGGTTEGSCPGIWLRYPDGGAERSLTAHADCSRFECAIHHGHVLRRSG